MAVRCHDKSFVLRFEAELNGGSAIFRVFDPALLGIAGDLIDDVLGEEYRFRLSADFLEAFENRPGILIPKIREQQEFGDRIRLRRTAVLGDESQFVKLIFRIGQPRDCEG